jgi:predicted deacetylase
MQTSALIVSLHDVSPLTRERSAKILADLADIGVEHISLLVIPDHHHRAPVLGNAGFRDWLQARSADGHEIVAHGFYHMRPQKSGESALTQAITKSYTAGEGEFFDLTELEARKLLQKGREVFAWCGFEPVGFIAPAWLLGDEALKAVRSEGFAYTTYLNRILPLRPLSSAGPESGNWTPEVRPVEFSQSLVWSVRAAWRRTLSLGWNRFLAARLRKAPVLRVGIHPPDWDHPAIRQQVLNLIRTALAGRTAFTYERWLQRSNA